MRPPLVLYDTHPLRDCLCKVRRSERAGERIVKLISAAFEKSKKSEEKQKKNIESCKIAIKSRNPSYKLFKSQKKKNVKYPYYYYIQYNACEIMN